MNEESVTPQELAEAKESATEVSKCPSCGANLTYNPAHGTLECEYCGTEVRVDMTEYAEEIDFSKLVENNRAWNDETRVYVCNNCGARQILSKREIAPKCACCGTSNIVETDSMSGLKPNAILPFLLGKESAGKFYTKWAKKKLFSPSSFKRDLKPEKISGNYYPAFTFDSNTRTPYVGRLGEYYYTSHTDSKGRVHTTRHTRYFNIGGTYEMFFNDVFVQASAPTDTKMLKKIGPFATDDSHKYSSDFLHGFSASQYEKDGLECWKEARGFMQSSVRANILSQYHYDVIESFSFNMHCYNTTYKYLLLPVYIGHSEYKKKLYRFYMNGQSGKVWGKTPKSPVRILTAVLLGLAVAAAVTVLCVMAAL